MKIKKERNYKLTHGITLISLVITIIILIILAGVAINISLGENGLFTRAKQAKEIYKQSAAKEKVEIVLLDAKIEKNENPEYNEEFLDNMLEESGIEVNGDVATVDNYNFTIDRENLTILTENGESNIKVSKKVQKYLGKNANEKYEAQILIVIESNTNLQKVEIIKPDGTMLLEMETDKEKITKNITIEFDEEYTVKVTTKDGKEEIRKIIEKSEETIRSEQDLALFRDKVNTGLTYEGKTLKVTRDLDLRSVCSEEKPWISIGEFNASVEGTYNTFSGTFNGNKHIIDYLYINTDSGLSQGLFGYTLNAIITGVVIGEHSTVNALSYEVGAAGVVGYAINTTISYCGNNGNVNGYNAVGGICGNLNCGEIIACYNKGDITGNVNVGGICGDSSIYILEEGNNVIQYCYNTGKIESSEGSNGGDVGGICGYPEGYTKIEKCYNKGFLKGNIGYIRRSRRIFES